MRESDASCFCFYLPLFCLGEDFYLLKERVPVSESYIVKRKKKGKKQV